MLTGPSALFEMEEAVIRGVALRVWKNLPPTLRALLQISRRHGERCFVAHEEERVSYEAHYRAVATLANWLIMHGVTKGQRVALAMRNLPEWPVVFFAAAAIGAIVVPLNAWWTGPELASALADCGAEILFSDAERHERLLPYLAQLREVRFAVVARASAAPIRLESLIGRPCEYQALADELLPRVKLAADDEATIFYTSGTTNLPKGVVGTHRNILSNIASSAYVAERNVLRRGQEPGSTGAKVRLLAVPLFHVTGCVAGLIAGMPAGNTNILMRRWDAGEALALIAREQVNVTGGVPAIAWQLLDHPERRSHDLSSLESIAYGGGPSAPELALRVHAELGAMPGNGWGMTETSGTVVGHSAEEFLAHPESCGLPVPVAELRVTSPAGETLAAGEVGELWAKGPMIAKGYWRRPDVTAETFLDGWVRTGDLARLDHEGFCYVVDRAKDVIIRGGENIYASEVENVLEAHPAVAEAALVGVPHRVLGEEAAAIVRLLPNSHSDEAELGSWVADRLARFKVPSRILVQCEPLPRNAAGKLIKAHLRGLFTAPEQEKVW